MHERARLLLETVNPRPTAAVAPLTINTQSKLAAKDAKRTRKSHSTTSETDDEDAASPHGGSSQVLAARGRGKEHCSDGGNGAGGGGVQAEIDAAPEGTTADTTQHVIDSPADFDGKIQLEGPPVHRWVRRRRGASCSARKRCGSRFVRSCCKRHRWIF